MHSSYMVVDAPESCAAETVIADEPADCPAYGETERLRQENEVLRGRVAALVRSNAELEQFAWAASHDLKEPLHTLSAYTNLLLQRMPPVPGSDEAEFAGFVQSSIERLHEMIDGLLDYARAGKGDDQVQVCDTTGIAGDAVEALQGLLAERRASVSLAPLPDVAAAPVPVLQIFSNLIGNALKYSAPGVPPQIDIFADEEPLSAGCPSSGRHMIRFGVRDNGIGIDSQYVERIFEPFQRLHGEEYPGIGLGLALSKRLVERYGGRIWVECCNDGQPGAGSTFYFTLPAAQAGSA